MRLFNVLVGLLFILLFAACSPSYETQRLYEYPINYRSQCFNKCKNNLFSCEKKALNIYNQCMTEANRRSKELFDYETQKYEVKINDYLKKEKRYQAQKKIYQSKFDALKIDEKYFSTRCSQADKYACEKLVHIKEALNKLSLPQSLIERKPELPSLNRILQTQSKNCIKNNLCQEEYDACFRACGGKVIYKQVCVANCDD